MDLSKLSDKQLNKLLSRIVIEPLNREEREAYLKYLLSSLSSSLSLSLPLSISREQVPA